MTEPTHLSGEELEIQARADAATRGPWTPQRRIFADKVWDAIIRDSKGNPVAVCYLAGWDKKSGAAHTDFIAHARTDVPRLLETLVAVRRELAELRSASSALDKRLDVLMPHIDGVIGLQSIRAGYDTWTHGSLADEWRALKKLLPAPPSEHSEGKQEP